MKKRRTTEQISQNKANCRRYYLANRAEVLLQAKAYREKNKEVIDSRARIRSKKRRERQKNIIFNHYGRICKCCGETRQAFLTIDHINNDGYLHRKQIGRGYSMYAWIVKNLPDWLQVLCMQCNFAKGRLGVCPHKIAISEIKLLSG